MRYIMFLLIVIIVFIKVCSNKNKEQEDFVATHDWKTIKKGQKVPQGLHYRINLEKGSTEAKLIDDKPDLSNNRKDLLQLHSESEKMYTPEEIKETLKNIKDESKYNENTKSEFRSYEQLKEELGVLNLTSKFDAEIIKDLLKEHKDEFAKDRVNIYNVLNILEDFSYLSHQFDNGLEFVNQNGFRDVIYKNLNFSSDKIKESSLRLFGSLVQNNARVQIHALETGGINVLLRILGSDSSPDLLKNAIFALGSLLRRFPLAQQQFVENGGIFVVLQLFEKSTLKIQVKLLTLMSDLSLEKKQAYKKSNQIVMSQYKLVNLEQQLIEQNWCTFIDKVLTDVVNKTPEDHDSIEKVLTALQTVANNCKLFNKQVLFNLKIKYESLAKLDSKTDDFFMDLFTLCCDILNDKTVKTEL